jgi:hypothetical protein
LKNECPFPVLLATPQGFKGINLGKILGIIAVSQSDFCLKKYPVRARPALYAAGELRAVELYKWTG